MTRRDAARSFEDRASAGTGWQVAESEDKGKAICFDVRTAPHVVQVGRVPVSLHCVARISGAPEGCSSHPKRRIVLSARS